MEYSRAKAKGQLFLEQPERFLHLPSALYGFRNTVTRTSLTRSGRNIICFEGEVDITAADRKCPCCGSLRMDSNGGQAIVLRHLPIGGTLSCVSFVHHQLQCRDCGATKMQNIPFKAAGHLITEPLHRYARDLLASGTCTNKLVGEITGLGKNVVKDIDKQRLLEKYTIGGEKLIQPERRAKFLGIDEFKLHSPWVFATHIMDLETGHILWISKGKDKRVVYDFAEHVGAEWLSGVQGIACDMNSDFAEAFAEKCPDALIVFDHFHIVKNFNEHVIAAVRKDEQKRLLEAGNKEGAASLKRTRYILTASRSTLEKRDRQAENGEKVREGSKLFHTEDIYRKGGHVSKYDALLQENKLFFTADLVKAKLDEAYETENLSTMRERIVEIIKLCCETANARFIWFADLLYKHLEGILAHAVMPISSGKVEGVNNKIKTVRRRAYGYPDDEYFFLKLFDYSRTVYVANPLSHRICD